MSRSTVPAWVHKVDLIAKEVGGEYLAHDTEVGCRVRVLDDAEVVVPVEACVAIVRLRKEANLHYQYLELATRQDAGLGPDYCDDADVSYYCRNLDDWAVDQEAQEHARLEDSEDDNGS